MPATDPKTARKRFVEAMRAIRNQGCGCDLMAGFICGLHDEMRAACDAFADAECSDEGGNEVNCFIHHQHRAALLKQIGL